MGMQTYDGKDVNVVGEVQVNGRPYLIVDPGASQYVNSVLVTYYLCSVSQFTHTQDGEYAEVVKDPIEDDATEEII